MVKKKGEVNNLRFEFLDIAHPTFKLPKTLGQKAADWLTEWAGSWYFITLFLALLVLWMVVNTSWILFGKTWDPYPFILLNLALSCLAAIQAPIILMSQNRELERDRTSARMDHYINRKAEHEVEDMQKDLEEIKNLIKSLVLLT